MDADAVMPRQGRSQSVRSSEEASNDRGAKGHRKLVGVMAVEGHMIQHSAQKAVRAGAVEAAGNRVALRGAAETRTQRKLCGLDGAVKRLRRSGQPTSSDQRPESRMPETGLSGLEGGARFKPSSLPLSQTVFVPSLGEDLGFFLLIDSFQPSPYSWQVRKARSSIS